MGVGSGTEVSMAVTLGDARVMACCYIVATHLVRQMEHLAPLDGTVAKDAGVRRPAGHILVNEVLNDAPPERLAKIHDVVLKPHALGIMLRLHDGVDGAAAFLLGDARVFHTVVGAEGHAHDLIALLQKKHSAHRGVYSSGHTQQNLRFCN